MFEIGIVDLLALPPQMLNHFPHINGIPHNHGIRGQIQARSLIELIVEMALANLRFVDDE